FDSSGYLTVKRDINGRDIGVPAFEIWLKSRFSFWRYKNNKGKKILQKPDLDLFLDYVNENGSYVSKALRTASYVPTEIKGTTNAFRFFPNPGANDVLVRDKKRVYTDILVPSTLFVT